MSNSDEEQDSIECPGGNEVNLIKVTKEVDLLVIRVMLQQSIQFGLACEIGKQVCKLYCVADMFNLETDIGYHFRV